MKTIEQLLNDAYIVQDACNLSGVVHSFSRAITDLRENGINDTDAINAHPVSILYSDKIASLTQSNDASVLSNAYGAIHN